MPSQRRLPTGGCERVVAGRILDDVLVDTFNDAAAHLVALAGERPNFSISAVPAASMGPNQ
jgi:hypothetical protein